MTELEIIISGGILISFLSIVVPVQSRIVRLWQLWTGLLLVAYGVSRTDLSLSFLPGVVMLVSMLDVGSSFLIDRRKGGG